MTKSAPYTPTVKRQKVLHTMFRQSCDVEYCVEQLKTTRPEQTDTMMAVISSIRSQIPHRGEPTIIPTVLLKRLYQFLMLRIGNLSSSWLNVEETDGLISKPILMQSLLLCFHDVVAYLCASVDIQQCYAILTPEDLCEIFTLIPQIVLGLHDASRARKVTMNDDTPTNQIISLCRVITVSLLRLPGCPERLLTMGMIEEGTIQLILYSLITGVACEGGVSSSSKDDVKTVLYILQTTTTAQCSEEVRSVSNIACAALLLLVEHQKSGTLCLPKEYSQMSTVHRVFFWKCIVYVYGHSMPATVADMALRESFFRSKLSTRSDVTITKFGENVSYVRDFVPHASSKMCLHVIAAIYERTLDNQKDYGCNSTTKMGLIDCIDSCVSRKDGSQIVLDVIKWPELFHFLMLALSTDISCHPPPFGHRECMRKENCDKTVSEKVARIAIPLLRQVLSQSQKALEEDIKDFERFITILLAALKSSKSTTVGEALDLLLAALEDKILQRRVACTDAMDLTHALAIVASNETLAERSKSGLTKVISLLIEDHCCVRFVAREPKILEFLIFIAGEQNATQGQHRDTAVYCLLMLATNPCDRRLLAKSPGLLSSMIRFVSSASTGIERSDAGGTGYTRDEMKEHIFLLAEAL
jgi:hypothetical protein